MLLELLLLELELALELLLELLLPLLLLALLLELLLLELLELPEPLLELLPPPQAASMETAEISNAPHSVSTFGSACV